MEMSVRGQDLIAYHRVPPSSKTLPTIKPIGRRVDNVCRGRVMELMAPKAHTHGKERIGSIDHGLDIPMAPGFLEDLEVEIQDRAELMAPSLDQHAAAEEDGSTALSVDR